MLSITTTILWKDRNGTTLMSEVAWDTLYNYYYSREGKGWYISYEKGCL